MRSAMSRSLRPLAPWYACPSSSLTALLNRSPGLAIPLTSTEELLGGGIPQPRNFVVPFSAKFCAGYYNSSPYVIKNLLPFLFASYLFRQTKVCAHFLDTTLHNAD